MNLNTYPAKKWQTTNTHKNTALLIGDSITRNIKSKMIENVFIPNATVERVTELTPQILSTKPYVQKVIVHVGLYDILPKESQGSELLKKDFYNLLKLLAKLPIQTFISGPIPILNRGVGSFSRLLSLNTWLTTVCATYGVDFIDNFNLFWLRNGVFKQDGIHPN